MGFRLNVDGSEIEMPVGELLVGRNDECQLRLVDDPLVSRLHAKFLYAADRLTVEDLGSRNGITVNGTSTRERVELHSGDVVGLGTTKITVVATGSGSRATPGRPRARVGRETLTLNPEKVPSGGAVRTALAPRTQLIERAISESNVSAAEYQLESFAEALLQDPASVRVTPALLRDYTRFALQLAQLSRKSAHIDRVFTLHKALSVRLSAPDIDDLHVVTRKMRYGVTAALRGYLDWVRERANELTPPERFALQRLEGLVRVLSASG